MFAGRHLKELGATTVGALGISFGSAATLNATHLPGAEEALDGGVLAICGPADTLRAAERLSRKVPPTHPAYAISSRRDASLAGARRPLARRDRHACRADRGARRALLRRHRGGDLGASSPGTTSRALASGARAHSRTTYRPGRARADPRGGGQQRARAGVDRTGGARAFDISIRGGRYAVYRTFFERWADYGDARPPHGTAPAAAEVVYSPPPRECQPRGEDVDGMDNNEIFRRRCGAVAAATGALASLRRPPALVGALASPVPRGPARVSGVEGAVDA